MEVLCYRWARHNIHFENRHFKIFETIIIILFQYQAGKTQNFGLRSVYPWLSKQHPTKRSSPVVDQTSAGMIETVYIVSYWRIQSIAEAKTYFCLSR